jgi:hypothetical protein
MTAANHAYLPEKVARPKRLVREGWATVEFRDSDVGSHKKLFLTTITTENESINDAFSRAALRIGAKLIYVSENVVSGYFD